MGLQLQLFNCNSLKSDSFNLTPILHACKSGVVKWLFAVSPLMEARRPSTVILCYFSGRESDYRRVLKPDGQEILMLALSSLEAAVAFLKNGSIEFQILVLISDHSERFLLLCEQIGKENEKPTLKQLLDQRCIELTAFQKEREKVSSFIRMCSFIKQGSRSNTCVDHSLRFCKIN